MTDETSTTWQISKSLSDNSAMSQFMKRAAQETSLPINDYASLWEWSVENPAEFWTCLAQFFDLTLEIDDRGALAVEAMPGAVWFPAAHTNYASQVLRHAQSGGVAIRHQSENGRMVDVSWPMPSMPLYLWGDMDGARFHESYFDTYPGIWRQGDWVKITDRGSGIIYGRSDATINRYGIRMGTADIYRVVEDRDEVLDSLVVDLEYLGKPSCMILFLKLAEGVGMDDSLKAVIIQDLKARVSPHHVPDRIETAPDIPFTLTGKKLEVLIKKRLLGKSMQEVVTLDAMANPDCLDWYETYAKAHIAS